MDARHLRLRTALSNRLGQELTPQLAYEIEKFAVEEPERAIDLKQFAPREYHGIVFAAESLREILPDLHLLHAAHWLETERYRAGSEMRPDYGHMQESERAGRLLQFTARRDGRLVGNLRIYLYTDLHTQELCAIEDTLFVDKSAREGFVASQFIDFAEECLRQVGVVDVFIDTKIVEGEDGSVVRDVGALMRRRKYKRVAERYHKRLQP